MTEKLFFSLTFWGFNLIVPYFVHHLLVLLLVDARTLVLGGALSLLHNPLSFLADGLVLLFVDGLVLLVIHYPASNMVELCVKLFLRF